MPEAIRAIALLPFLLPAPLLAQSADSALEEWQRRLLEAIEETADRPDAAPADAYRGTLDDDAAAEAARKARERHGGRVLAVGRVGDKYRVRLLLDDGRVVTVEVSE